jgi:hypothetical protein
MMEKKTRVAEILLVGAIVAVSMGMVVATVFQDVQLAWGAGSSQTASSTVVVANAAPAVSSVSLNGGSSITLTANATTSVSVNSTVTDFNGCSDITNGTSSVLVYRSGITSSTCNGAQSDKSCYKLTTFTATSSCSNGVTLTTTSTFGVYYFADATDASSSYGPQNWTATVLVTDGAGATSTGSLDATGVELLTLTAINVTTSSLNYGTLSASSTTGSVNQTATSTNAGNSSTTLRLSVNSTLTSGINSIATSSQAYATSTFTYPGLSVPLTASPVTVTGFFLTQPTSTANVQQTTFWGLQVPAGTATGTYSGVNLFTSLFQP